MVRNGRQEILDAILRSYHGSHISCGRSLSRQPSTRSATLVIPFSRSYLYGFHVIYHLVPTLMGIFSVSAIFSEFGNGANFSLVPHCNSHNNVRLFYFSIIRTVRLQLLTGRYVWSCRVLRQPGWHYICPHISVRNQLRKSNLDYWFYMHGHQCRLSGDPCT
jgi:hypothetical protein